MHATSSTVIYIRDRTTQVLHTGCGADRWNRFLSSFSRADELRGVKPASDASIVAKWWCLHSGAWAPRILFNSYFQKGIER